MNTVITIDEDKSVDVSTEITIGKMMKPKQRQKLSKGKNVYRILTKVKGELSKKRQITELEEGVILMEYADSISNNLTWNHNYINK